MNEPVRDRRLRRALEGLKRHRRRQYVDQDPWLERYGHWSVLIGTIVIFVGCGIADAGLFWYPGPVVWLGFLLCFLGFFSAFLSPVLESVGTLLMLVLRIPSMLLFEVRVHLLELILIVALLGNGIGLVVSKMARTDAFVAVLLCVLWGIVVLGGAAWGLWVCKVLAIEGAWTRCSLVLTGVLAPAAIPGIAVAPFLASGGLICAQGRIHPLLSLVAAGVITAAAIVVLGRAIRYYSEARCALQEQHRHGGV